MANIYVNDEFKEIDINKITMEKRKEIHFGIEMELTVLVVQGLH